MEDGPVDRGDLDRFVWVVGAENDRVPIEAWIERLPEEMRTGIEAHSGSTTAPPRRWYALIAVCTTLLVGSAGTILGSALAIDAGAAIPVEYVVASFVVFAVGRIGLAIGVWRDSVHVTATVGRRPVRTALAIAGTTVAPPPLEILSAVGYLWYRRQLAISR